MTQLVSFMKIYITIYNIKKKTLANAVIIDGNGSETIDGSETIVIINKYESVTLQCDGLAWWII